MGIDVTVVAERKHGGRWSPVASWPPYNLANLNLNGIFECLREAKIGARHLPTDANPETRLLFEDDPEIYSASAADVLAAIVSLDVEMWRMGCAPELRERENLEPYAAQLAAKSGHPVMEDNPDPPKYDDDADAKAPLRRYENAESVVSWLEGFVLDEGLPARLVWSFS